MILKARNLMRVFCFSILSLMFTNIFAMGLLEAKSRCPILDVMRYFKNTESSSYPDRGRIYGYNADARMFYSDDVPPPKDYANGSPIKNLNYHVNEKGKYGSVECHFGSCMITCYYSYLDNQNNEYLLKMETS